MTVALKKTKTVILVTDVAGEGVDVYNNLRAFTNRNKDYSYNTITNHLSREGKPYTDGSVKVERVEVIR